MALKKIETDLIIKPKDTRPQLKLEKIYPAFWDGSRPISNLKGSKVPNAIKVKNIPLSYIKPSNKPWYKLTLTTSFHGKAGADEAERMEYHYNKTEQVIDDLTQKGFEILDAKCYMHQVISC